jgi:signal transduction histidine kinase
MNLRQRFVLLHTLLVSLILAVAFFIIYVIYSNTREDDFAKRLWAQAIISYENFDSTYTPDRTEETLLENAVVGPLATPSVVILDAGGNIVFQKPAISNINWDAAVLANIKTRKQFLFRDDYYGCFGTYIPFSKHYVIVKANDKYGLERMAKLRLIMFFAGAGTIIITAFFSFFYVMRTTKPLVQLSQQMLNISENNLKERFNLGKGNIEKNELMQVRANFNSMLERLEKAFDMQKSFTHHASHELRTPLASMLAQTELALRKNLTIEEAKEVLVSLKEDQQELIELTNSLLLLSQYEKISYSSDWPMVRVDELLYDTISMIKRMFPNISISLEFLQMPEDEISLSISGNYTLLRSAFRNLIKNAFQYSEDKTVSITIKADAKTIDVYFDNRGKTLNEKDKDRLFIPFFRGENAIRKRGFGLGLSIVKRIVQLHQGTISYEVPNEKTNRFTVSFTKG